MNIIEKLFGGAGNGQGSPGYNRVLTEDDFTTTDHQKLTSTSDWTEVAYYKISADEELYAGYGDINHPENEGRLYVILRTGEATPVEITGSWRLIYTNRPRNRKTVIETYDEALTHGDLNDKRKQIPLPRYPMKITEDKYLAIEVKPKAVHETAGAGNDNLGWADATETQIKIPVTIIE